MRFVKNTFNPEQKSTINAYYQEKKVQIDNYGTFKIALWVFKLLTFTCFTFN